MPWMAQGTAFSLQGAPGRSRSASRSPLHCRNRRPDNSRLTGAGLPPRHSAGPERALRAELGCTDVLMLVASVRGAVGGLTTELLEDHIRHHVVDSDREKDPEKAKGAADLIHVVRTYLK
jgi:FrmR/RcnR family transcriptional regulator, repressor of frmRAB operon